jgi:hypothetical protein
MVFFSSYWYEHCIIWCAAQNERTDANCQYTVANSTSILYQMHCKFLNLINKIYFSIDITCVQCIYMYIGV